MTAKTAPNIDNPKHEVLQSAVRHPAECPKAVTCIQGCNPDYGETFVVLGKISSLVEYTKAGHLWTCDTYYLRNQFDGGCIIAPCSWFERIEA